MSFQAQHVVLTADLMQQVRSDRAVGLGTLIRRYGVTRETMLAAVRHHGLHVTVINVEAVRGQSRSDGAYLVVHPRLQPVTFRHSELSHYAGLAEMRLMIRATPEEWHHAGAENDGETTATERRLPPSAEERRSDELKMRQSQQQAQAKPDAYFKRANREFAVEYDRGTYSPGRRELKLRTSIVASRPTIWGCPIARRLLLVRAAAAAIEDGLARERLKAYGKADPSIELRLLPVYWHRGSEVEG